MTESLQRALLVGINAYDHLEHLNWCVEDALAMQRALEVHEDHSPNFDCRILLGQREMATPSDSANGYHKVTHTLLSTELEKLFDHDSMALFYFSGHGYEGEHGVYLVTQDATSDLPGIKLNDLLFMANNARAKEVLLIIDSCSSGAFGEPEQSSVLGVPGQRNGIERLYLRPGVTLLAAAGSGQDALELNGHGLFTHLVLGALKGGASDVRGQISAASIYAYVEQALGAWDQRPIYKSNAHQLSTIRKYTPDVKDEELRMLPFYFSTPEFRFPMDPSYESTSDHPIPERVALFRTFKRFQVARLLRPTSDTDLYFAAIHGRTIELTPLGQFYWQLAKNGRFGAPPAVVPAIAGARKPDPEEVARLFHEVYERNAPRMGYETREDSRVPWEEVPAPNKNLMIQTVREVLASLFPSDLEKPSARSVSEFLPE